MTKTASEATVTSHGGVHGSLLESLTRPLNLRIIPPERDLERVVVSTKQIDYEIGTELEERSLLSRWIRTPGEELRLLPMWDGIADIYFCPHGVEYGQHASKTTITHVNALTLDLDFELASWEFKPEELLLQCREVGVDPPTALVATGGGYHVYWVFEQAIYTGPRRGQDRRTQLKRLDQMARWYSDTAGKLVKLFEDLGADPKATDLPHVFRVPGFRSVKRGVRVDVVHLDRGAKTSLGDLSDQASAALKKHQVERDRIPVQRAEPTPTPSVKTAETPAPAQAASVMLETDGYRWLRSSRFTQGNRNHAFFSLAATLKMSGWEYADAWVELTAWRRQNTTPTYPTREAERVLRAIWRYGYGLDKAQLLEIQDAKGRTMPEHAADSLIQAMPKADRQRAKRRNMPLIHHIGHILGHLLRTRVTSDTPISASEMATAAGLSEKQVERVEQFFTKIGVRVVKRHGQSFIGIWNLRRLKVAPPLVIHHFGEWAGYIEDLKLKLWRWWRKLRAMMKQLMSVLNALAKLLKSVSGGETAPEDEDGDRGSSRRTDGIRGPPTGVGEAA